MGSPVALRDVQLAVVLGQRYEEPLIERDVFEIDAAVASDVAVRCPWRTVAFAGNGEQMAWLNAETEASRQIRAGSGQPSVATDGGDA